MLREEQIGPLHYHLQIQNHSFYPSVGLTGVITEMFEMPEAVSFAKIRVSYAEVGRDLPAFASNSHKDVLTL